MSTNIWFTIQTSCTLNITSRWQAIFFPYPWIKYTSIKNIGLRIRTDRALKVFVHQHEAVDRIRAEHTFPQGETVLDLGEVETCGDFLSCRIEGNIPSGITIEWVCSQHPVCKPSLAVIICTYNREPQIRSLLDTLKQQVDSIGTICIVNQGIPNLAARIRRKDDPVSLQIIEQPNYGGAGGFTRGIIESLAKSEITHFVLMDDDVEISDTLIHRLKAICAYIPDNLCIGGTMLNVQNPSSVISLGHNVDLDRLAVQDLVPKGGLSLDDDATLRRMATADVVDFCGWWCCCMPRRAIEQCGLPLPLFIRGDDAEYGFRLTRSGFRTVMWPGIAVKHHVLTSQSRAWHHFYDRRNALIRSFFHMTAGRQPSISPVVRGIVNALVTYRYDFADSGVLALAAYQKGAEDLAQLGGQAQRELMARGIKDEHAFDVKPLRISRYSTSRMRTIITIIRLIGDIFSWKSKSSTIKVFESHDWVSGTRQRPHAVFIKYGDRVTFLERDPSQVRRIVFNLLKTIFSYYCNKKPSHAEIMEMTTIKWWEEKFHK